MTVANWVTLSRMFLVPIFLIILMTEMDNKEIIGFIVFTVAAITDSIDGYIARKYNQITNLGKFLDPLADKILVISALLTLVALNRVETWAVAIIIIRELFMTTFRFYFMINKSNFSASWLAKKKTFFQMSAISVLIVYNKLPQPDLFFEIGQVLMYVAVALSVFSAVEYVVKYSKAISIK